MKRIVQSRAEDPCKRRLTQEANREKVYRATYEAFLAGESTSSDSIAKLTGLGKRATHTHQKALHESGRLVARTGLYAPAQIETPLSKIHELYLQKRSQRDWMYTYKGADDETIYKRLVLIVGEWIHRGKNMKDLECLISADLKRSPEKPASEK